MTQGDLAVRIGTNIVNERLDSLGRAVGMELLRRLIYATPVDTGRARGNWNASVNQEDPSDDPERRLDRALSEGAGRISAFRLSRSVLYLTNGVPYIEPLNNGHSRQAPAAFIQLAVEDMRRFVSEVAARENLRG